MRKTTIATILAIVALSIGGFIYLNEPFNPDRAEVQDLSNQFLEDIKFKDFGASALYHHELEQDRVDIGKAIEDLFLLKPEMLRILDYRITDTEVDSSGDRARVLVNTRFRPLNHDAEDDIKESDLQLYWMRRHPECPLGTDCISGTCLTESGDVAMMDDDDFIHGDEEEPHDRPFECDENLEHQWFMNLDSTLESREYR